jgi:hypothetical protein
VPLPDELKILLNLRYVLFSPTLGCYLGDGKWVLRNRPDKIESAPTYEKWEADKIIANWKEAPEPVTDCRPVEVSPDLPGNRASNRALNSRLVPSWE